MKKIIIFLLLVISITNTQAQKNLPYKSLAEFKNDTTAFIIYNFMDRADQYKGKKITDVAIDLQIPIKYILGQPYSIEDIGEARIYIWKPNPNGSRDFPSLIIEWEQAKLVAEGYLQMRESDISTKINYYNKYIINNISVSIPKSSKYFEKYKPKETKSADDHIKIETIIGKDGEEIRRTTIQKR